MRELLKFSGLAATAQPRNRATAQPRNRATAQPRNRATAQPRNRATAQPRNSAGNSFAIIQPPSVAAGLRITILILFSVLGAASLSFGQGEVDFENFNNSLISTSGGPTTGLISGPAGSYYFMLLSAETGTTTIDATLGGGRALDNGGWSTEDLGYSTGTPGLMYGNITSDPATLVFWPSGFPVNFAVVGWSANIGNNWGLAKAWWNNGNPNSGPSGYFGISGVAQDILVGGNPYPIPTLFGPTAGGEIQGFTLNYYSVPEPSTFSLVGFGVAVFFVFKRRPVEQFRQHSRGGMKTL